MDLEQARPLVRTKQTPSQHVAEEEGALTIHAPDPRDIQWVSNLQVIPGGQREGNHRDELFQGNLLLDDPLQGAIHLDDPLQGDPRQDATNALGPPLAPRTLAMPGMTVMRTVHSHGASEKLLFPAD